MMFSIRLYNYLSHIHIHFIFYLGPLQHVFQTVVYVTKNQSEIFYFKNIPALPPLL